LLSLVRKCDCARPPLAQERLGRLDDEHLAYRLRKPTMDGRTELILTPLELLDRLAWLVTPPRQPMRIIAFFLDPPVVAAG